MEPLKPSFGSSHSKPSPRTARRKVAYILVLRLQSHTVRTRIIKPHRFRDHDPRKPLKKIAPMQLAYSSDVPQFAISYGLKLDYVHACREFSCKVAARYSPEHGRECGVQDPTFGFRAASFFYLGNTPSAERIVSSGFAAEMTANCWRYQVHECTWQFQG